MRFYIKCRTKFLQGRIFRPGRAVFYSGKRNITYSAQFSQFTLGKLSFMSPERNIISKESLQVYAFIHIIENKLKVTV